MVCLGLEPRVAEWKAQTNPLSYGGTPSSAPVSIPNSVHKICLAPVNHHPGLPHWGQCCKTLTATTKIFKMKLVKWNYVDTYQRRNQTALQSVRPDWAIYCTLGDFLKPLATINLTKSPTFLVSKSIIFLVKSFLGNFNRHLAIFSGHTGSNLSLIDGQARERSL